MKFLMLKLFVLLQLTGILVAQTGPPKSRLFSYTQWVALTNSSITVEVEEGQWLIMTTTCVTNNRLEDCDQPEYQWDGEYVKIPLLDRTTIDEVTAQTFGMFMPMTGKITIYDYVVYNDVPYQHTLEIDSVLN